MFVDSDHAGENVLQIKECFLIYMDTTLVKWFSNKQSTVETSVFCTELVTMKQGIDALRA